MDLEELTQRAKEGKPLYGESSQPMWVQGAAHRNSAYSQLKFGAFLFISSICNLMLIPVLLAAFPMSVRCLAMLIFTDMFPKVQPRASPLPWNRSCEVWCQNGAVLRGVQVAFVLCLSWWSVNIKPLSRLGWFFIVLDVSG